MEKTLSEVERLFKHLPCCMNKCSDCAILPVVVTSEQRKGPAFSRLKFPRLMSFKVNCDWFWMSDWIQFYRKSGFAKIVSVSVLIKGNAMNERWWTQLNYAYLNGIKINLNNSFWYQEFFSLEPEILFITSTGTILWKLFSEYHDSWCQFKTIWSKRMERGIINIP